MRALFPTRSLRVKHLGIAWAPVSDEVKRGAVYPVEGRTYFVMLSVHKRMESLWRDQLW